MSVPEDGFGELLDAAVYRIVQESVSNAVRHGTPGTIAIDVKTTGDEIVVCVKDDGGGLKPNGTEGCFGILGMRERVNSLGGTLDVTDRPDGRGVMVSAHVPTAAAQHEQPFLAAHTQNMNRTAAIHEDPTRRRSHRGARGRTAPAWRESAASSCREAETGDAALEMFERQRPDLVVLDLNLAGMGGLEILRRLLAIDAKVRVVVFSMHAEPIYAARALRLGARGYVSKSAGASELVTAVKRVAEGGRYVESEIASELAFTQLSADDPLQQLTAREIEILRLLGEGSSLTEIARAIGVAYKTVANSCSIIKSKLGVERTADLIRVSIALK